MITIEIKINPKMTERDIEQFKLLTGLNLKKSNWEFYLKSRLTPKGIIYYNLGKDIKFDIGDVLDNCFYNGVF